MPRALSRRSLIRGLGAVPLAALAACTKQPVKFAGPGMRRRLIDAHCHIFNVTDLAASSFAQQVFLKDYVETIPPTRPQLKLRDALRKIERIISYRVLRAGSEADASSGMKALLLDAAQLTVEEEKALANEEKRAEDALRELEGSQKLFDCPGRKTKPSLGSVVRWLRSLRSPRANLAGELVGAHRASGFATELLVPALVDYSNWLGQELTSPLPHQIRAMASVSRNTALPPVHGYMAFDPLRRALIRKGLPTVDGTWDPLQLTRQALKEHGFIGVKLYPPMGFRPSGNASAGQRYQPQLVRAFGTAEQLGFELDKSLDELWGLCRELDAPVIAHAAESNAAGRDFATRADPTWWFPVLERHRSLRVLLAHFGRFRSFAAESGQTENCESDVPFEHSWEAAIGRFVKRRPGQLFSDISYLSEIFGKRERKRAVERFKAYLQLDPGGRHLVFGSDWVMLGIESDYLRGGGYPHRVADFLADTGLSPAEIDNIMYGNALRFLGLTAPSGARKRLLDFYERHGLPAERLPMVDAVPQALISTQAKRPIPLA
jgi:predicted TIM-barrel fold metal-dependent hydrolase